MTDAVIVSTARTPLCKSWRGALNITHGATMGGHVIKAAVERAGIEAGEVDDVILGCANPEGATGWGHRPPSRSACRHASVGVRHDGQSLLLLRSTNSGARGATHYDG